MPAGGALFGSAAAGGPGSTGGNKHLIEVKAGKMNLKGRMVYPDTRKGLLYVYQSDDSLMHFCWQDRTTGIVEDDLIIFPDDCEYVKIPQCTTGRVYLLKFKSSNKKFFFWLQEPKTDKDEDNCKRINELLNNPSSAVQNTSNSDRDLQSLFNNMSQSQLMQLFGSGGVGQMGLSSLLGNIRGQNSGSARTNRTPAITHRNTNSTVPRTPTTTARNTQPSVTAEKKTPQNSAIPKVTPDAPRPKGRNSTSESPSYEPIQLADLQNFLTGIAPPSGNASAVAQQQPALTGESLAGVRNGPDTLQQLQTQLPAVDQNTHETLRSTLASQFQQAVPQSSNVLELPQLSAQNNPETLQQSHVHLPAVDQNTQESLRSSLASQFQQAVSQFTNALELPQLFVIPGALTAAAQESMAGFVQGLDDSSTDVSADKDKEAVQKKDDKKDYKKDDKKDYKKDDDDQMQHD